MYDETNQDWVPTLNLGYERKHSSGDSRYNRRIHQKEMVKLMDAAASLIQLRSAFDDIDSDPLTEFRHEVTDVRLQTVNY